MKEENKNKIILDLCGGTGSWSKPYKDAGYDVITITLPDYDVRLPQKWPSRIYFESQTGKPELNIPVDDVYGILAAPPCTMFSYARTNAKKPRDLREGMECVRACIDIIWRCMEVSQPTAKKEIPLKFWAMENPKGLLRKFMGKPKFEFDASEFGCDYNKHTDLWGYFKEPRKSKGYTRFASTDKNTRKLPPIPEDYEIDTGMSKTAIRRSITPQSFAQAFYKANP